MGGGGGFIQILKLCDYVYSYFYKESIKKKALFYFLNVSFIEVKLLLLVSFPDSKCVTRDEFVCDTHLSMRTGRNHIDVWVISLPNGSRSELILSATF